MNFFLSCHPLCGKGGWKYPLLQAVRMVKNFYWKNSKLGFSYEGNILSAVLACNKFLRDYIKRQISK